MQVYLTFDYEIYFGDRPGSVEKCMLEPTRMLTEMADKHGVKLCQFVDIGFLLKMEDEMKNIHRYKKIMLHFALNWNRFGKQDTIYNYIFIRIGKTVTTTAINGYAKVDRYKLDDFSDAEITAICMRYKNRLEQFTGPNEIYAFRAGGWCIQPFTRFKKALSENGICVDSSVFANGHYESDLYNYDFRGAPLKGKWKFSDDPIVENEEGTFTEIPISSIHNSPLFYWRLFLLGRLNPYEHKPLGDGIPVAAPGQRLKILSRWTHNTVSVDGYNASLLWRAYSQHKKMQKDEMVVIGHPKALSRYGLKALEQFIIDKKSENSFTTFREQKSKFL